MSKKRLIAFEMAPALGLFSLVLVTLLSMPAKAADVQQEAAKNLDTRIFLVVSRTSNAFKSGAVTERMDGSVNINYSKIRTCSANFEIDYVLSQHFKESQRLEAIKSNYEILDYPDPRLESYRSDDSTLGRNCDAALEYAFAMRRRIARYDEDYVRKILIFLPYIEKEQVDPLVIEFKAKQRAHWKKFDTLKRGLAEGVGTDHVWIYFRSYNYYNINGICYRSDADGVIEVLRKSKEWRPFAPQEWVGLSGDIRDRRERVAASPEEIFQLAQEKQCSIILAKLPDAAQLTKAFDRIGMEWSMAGTWITEAQFDSALFQVEYINTQKSLEKRRAKEKRQAENQRRMDEYRRCTATPSCKAERERKEEEKKQARLAEQRAKYKRYPYVAYIDCRVNGQPSYWTACFGSLRITSDNRTKAWNISEVTGSSHSSNNRDSLRFELTRSYQIVMQGTGDRYIAVQVVIEDRKGNVVFQDQKTGYGVIRAGN